MSDGELEHLMSQLGGQIETIDAPAFLGGFIDENRAAADAAKVGFARSATANRTSSIAHGSVRVMPLDINSPPEDRNKTTPITYLPANHTHAIDRVTKGTTQYHTYWAKGNPRNYPLHAYKNAQTHNDHGHLHFTGTTIWHNPPEAGDTHWPGGKKPYGRGPLPRDYDWHTHFFDGKPRKPEHRIPMNVVYDPNHNKTKNAQSKPNHAAHDDQMINALKEKIAKLEKTNNHLQKQLNEQKEARAREQTKHKTNIAAKRGNGGGSAAAGRVSGRGGRGGRSN
jgi:hypothetical protein